MNGPKRISLWAKTQTISVAALEERLRRVNEMYELGRIGRAERDQKCADIEDQRTRIAAPPAPSSRSRSRS